MHILCSTDSNYIMPTGVMIKSASVNNSDVDIVFHVLVDKSVNDIHKKLIEDVVSDNKRHSVKFYEMKNDALSTYPNIGKAKSYITNATYYRLIVANILDDDINKVIYLDGDIIVNGSLSDLYNYDIDDLAVAAVTDMSEKKHDYKRLGYPYEKGYFNAGVLLINLKYWRNHDLQSDFIDLIENHSERIKLHDQDVLNIVLADKKAILPFRYNCQHGFLFKKECLELDGDRYVSELLDSINNYVVVHFTAGVKPWHKECIHPLKNLWFHYLNITEWRNYKPKSKFKLTLRNKIGNILRYLKLRPQLPPEENPYIEELYNS